MSTIGPEIPGQLLYVTPLCGTPPSCSSTTMARRPARCELRGQRVAGLHLVLEVEPGDTGRRDELGVPSSVMPMNADLGAGDLLDPGTAGAGFRRWLVDDVRRRGTGSRRRRSDARDRAAVLVVSPSTVVQAAAVLHPQQLGRRPRRTRGCRRWTRRARIAFIVSMVGSSWKAADSSGLAADQVARRHGERVAACAAPRDGCEVLRAAGDGVDRGAGWLVVPVRMFGRRAGGLLDLAVEVVERQQLAGRRSWPASASARRSMARQTFPKRR